MNKIFFILLSTLLPLAHLSAQEKGKVSVHSDPRLALLISKSNPVERPEPPKLPVVKKETPKRSEAKIPTSRMEEVRKEAREFAAERNAPAKTKPSSEELRAMKRAGVRGSTIGANYRGAGFRVQIYNGPNRNEALRIKAEFMRNYPGIQTYFSFSSPHYRVKAGNFRRREDAVGLFREANDTYKPCMIVPDMLGAN